MVASWGGRGPDRAVAVKSMRHRLGRVPRAGGMEPPRGLDPRSRLERAVRRESSEGMPPVRRLNCRLRTSRVTRVVMAGARGPEADMPVTRETQNFALRVRELRLPCR